jgi:hypothetical protein
VRQILFTSFLIFVLAGLTASAVAHRYFFGLTELSVNPQSQQVEIIHQLTAHDIDNAIAQKKQIHFSPAHPDYDNLVKAYVENHFKLSYYNQNISLKWIGLEIVKDKVFIYQEANFENYLSGLVVKNDLLVDTYPKQVNTVNYQDNKIKGSLTFTDINKVAKITQQ